MLFTFSYCIPMMLIIYYYSQICKHVFSHEKALRVQAKKMNIESLRTTTSSTTAEVRIARAAITICFLFVAGTVKFTFIQHSFQFGRIWRALIFIIIRWIYWLLLKWNNFTLQRCVIFCNGRWSCCHSYSMDTIRYNGFNRIIWK